MKSGMVVISSISSRTGENQKEVILRTQLQKQDDTLVESAAQEFKEAKINMNCVLPTTIDTDANRKAMPNADFSKWLSTEDLANVILFLCSSGARVINGSAIPTFYSLK